MAQQSPYLLLAVIDRQIDQTKPVQSQEAVAALEDTPYDGMTFFPYATYGASCEWVRDNLPTTKDLWAYQTLGPFIKDGKPDFGDVSGGRTAFLTYWQEALTLTALKGWPGVFLDLEDYTGTGVLIYVADGAQILNITVTEYQNLLYEFGQELAQKATEIFPNVVVWNYQAFLYPGGDYHGTYWITKGILDGLNPSSKMVLGCGTRFPIPFSTMSAFYEKLDYVTALYAPTLVEYSACELGPSFFFHDIPENTNGWVKDGLDGFSAGAGLDFRNPSDWHLPLSILQERFNYLWGYNDLRTNYFPVDPTKNEPFNAVLRKLRYRKLITQQQANSAIYDTPSALADFDRLAFVRPEELS